MFEWILLVVIGAIVLVILVLPFALLGVSSAKQYNLRADNEYLISIKEFEGLEYEKVGFKNNNGQNLTGYKFFKKGKNYKAVILLIPGFKNNHNHYLPEIDYFTSQDYLVFSFDPTATGRSEGDRVRGLLQIPFDAQCALNYIKQDASLGGKPLFLWGFSNGGYAALALLNDDKVLAAASLSAFNAVNKMTVDNAVLSFGKQAVLICPYCAVFNRLKYGKNPFGSALSKIKTCRKPVFLAHGSHDSVVPYKAFLGLQKHNTHPLSVNLTVEGGDHWIRYPNKIKKIKDRLKIRLEQADSETKPKIKKCYASIAKKINFELAERITKFYDSVLEQIK
ncbi:MAG: prolyl oligopeptidase family serine peptidase [Clostridiales bacterium]|nr:prolyl oligopeptidase family serine peptidase [Clostridiales bacterium]